MVESTVTAAGIVTKVAARSVDDTVRLLCELAAAKAMTVFAVIDHSQAAQDHGLALRETKVVVFGSPVGGTPVMEATPLVALDLPLKVLVWADTGATKVSYTSPAALAARYGLSDEQAARFAGLDALTDALTGAGGDTVTH
ncbi:MAG: DUF302 domain-containing protein [Acidimicrobiales bacterium]